MIIKHIIQGSTDTTMTDFQCVQEGNILTLRLGLYKNGSFDIKREQIEDQFEITADPEKSKDVTAYLRADGLFLVQQIYEGDMPGEISDMVDRMIWFTVPAGITDFDSLEIHCIEITQ